MSNRTFCDEGEHCVSCTMGAEFLKLGMRPSFEVQEETGRCHYFTEEPIFGFDQGMKEKN